MIKINLLAEAKPTKKKKGASALGAAGQLNLILLGSAIAVGLLVIFVRWYMLNTEIKNYDNEIRKAQAEVKRLEAILKEVKDFEDKKARLQKKVDLINQLKLNQRGPVRLMDEVSKALPDLLWVDRMEYKGNGITLTGKAINWPAVANFIENLRRVQAFQEPTLREVTVCASTLTCFNLGFVFANIDKTQAQPTPPPAAAPAPGAAPGTGSAAPPAKADASGLGRTAAPASVPAGM